MDRLQRTHSVVRGTLFLLALLWTGWLQEQYQLGSYWLYAAIAYVVITSVALAVVPAKQGQSLFRSFIVPFVHLGDAVVIAAGVGLTGGIHSPLFVLFIPLIISSGIVWGPMQGLQYTTVISLMYLAVIMLSADGVSTSEILVPLLITVPVMITVCIYLHMVIQDHQIERRRRQYLESEQLYYKHKMVSLQLKKDKVERMAMRDPLTGLYNHGYFQTHLKKVLGQSFKYKIPTSLLMIDIDRFKAVNDTYGHQFGDKVLSRVAELISQSVREEDVVARYGGEEMAVVLANCSMEVARQKAERIRKCVEAETFYLDGSSVPIKVTVSIGVSESFGNEMPERLIERADQALYQAKNQGRNQVVVRLGPPQEG